MEQTLDELAITLFRTFARFEYSLKASGFHYGDGNAEPNWRSFAESISEIFEELADEEVGAAVDYMLKYPPKKQVIEDGFLTWDDSQPDTNLKADLVLLYVRRVRNNLLHGGKFNDRWFEPERSEHLLRHSLTILGACLDASPNVREAHDN